jgi:hypothetical protein
MNLDKQTIEEWDKLGFYYEYEDGFKQWRFFGSKIGLQKFSVLIKSYASNLSNDAISEHTHIGPYNYLKIMTWHEPVITKEWIAGPLKDLLRLSELISNKISSVEIGSIFKISDEYSVNNTSILLFVVVADDFKPSSIEF